MGSDIWKNGAANGSFLDEGMETASVLEPFISSALIGFSIVINGTALYRVLNKRTTEGLSMATCLMATFGTGTWATYGVVNGQTTQFIANGIGFAVNLLILLIARHYQRLNTSRAICSAAGYVAMVGAAMAVTGPVAVGIILMAMTLVQKLPQAWESYKRPGGIALSVPSLVVNIGAKRCLGNVRIAACGLRRCCNVFVYRCSGIVRRHPHC